MNKYYENILEKYFVRHRNQFDFFVTNIDKINLWCIDDDNLDTKTNKLLKEINIRCIEYSKDNSYIAIEINFNPNDWANSRYYYYYLSDTSIIKNWQKFRQIYTNWYLINIPYESNLSDYLDKN